MYYALLVIGGLNTAFSAFYYMRILKAMAFERPIEEIENRPVPPLGISPAAAAYATVLAGIVLVMGLIVNPLSTVTESGASQFSKEQPVAPQPKATGGAQGKNAGIRRGANP